MAAAIVNTQIAGDGAVIVDLHGEPYLAVNKALHDILIDAIRTERPARVVVNMRHVGLVDSTGMSARRAGVGLEVGKVAPCVAQHLHAVHLFDHHVPGRRRLSDLGRRRATGHRSPGAAPRAPA